MELNTPYRIRHNAYTGFETVVDCDGSHLFDCYESDAEELIKRINSYDELKEENERLRSKTDALMQEAKSHAMEAKTQKSTVHKIYQLVGAKEGDWNSAKPVEEYIDRLKARIARLEDITGTVLDNLNDPDSGSIYAKKVLNESPQQSLNEIRADAVEDKRLDLPAKVGVGTFEKGVKWRLVVEAAQRQYEYSEQLQNSEDEQ